MEDKVDEGLERLEGKIDEGLECLEGKIDEGLERLEGKVDGLEAKMTSIIRREIRAAMATNGS